MRVAKIIFLIWLITSVAIWIRQGQGACIGESLPFVVRSQPLSPRYDLYALALLAIAVVGAFAITSDRSKLPPVVRPRRPSIAVILVVGVGTALALAIFEQRIRPAIHFDQVVGSSGNVEELRYLALLGLCVLVFLLCVRAFRDR